MKHLLTLLLVLLCVSMTGIPDTHRRDREEAMRLYKSTLITTYSDEQGDSMIKILDRAIRLDSSRWEFYDRKAFFLDGDRQPEALEMLRQLEREGRFSDRSRLYSSIGDYYYHCMYDKAGSRPFYRKAQAVDEAAFAAHPCDSLIGALAYIYRHLYSKKVALQKCTELFKQSPETNSAKRKEAEIEVRDWIRIPDANIGPCALQDSIMNGFLKAKYRHMVKTARAPKRKHSKR